MLEPAEATPDPAAEPDPGAALSASELETAPELDSGAPLRLEGELLVGPVGPALRVLQVISLWFLVQLAARSVDRFVLGNGRRGALLLAPTGLTLEIQSQRLGRESARSSSLLPLSAVAEVRLERTGPSPILTVGLVGLALGTLLGTGILVEGLQAPGSAPALLLFGLAAIVAGLVFDFGLERGRLRRGPPPARLVVRCLKGPGWILRGVDPNSAARLLQALSAPVAP